MPKTLSKVMRFTTSTPDRKCTPNETKWQMHWTHTNCNRWNIHTVYLWHRTCNQIAHFIWTFFNGKGENVPYLNYARVNGQLIKLNQLPRPATVLISFQFAWLFILIVMQFCSNNGTPNLGNIYMNSPFSLDLNWTNEVRCWVKRNLS